MVCLGAAMAVFFQPRHSLSEIANLASTAASTASESATGFFTGRAPFVPDSFQYDEIEKMWQAANRARGGKMRRPVTLAHSFESKTWYSERLHPAALGVRSTWIRVLSGFMKDLPVASFAADDVVAHYKMNANDVQDTCVLVRVQGGKATFEKTFSDGRHGRYASVVYMIERVLSEGSRGIPDVTFLVMLNDGHNPGVPTLGSARHWDSWKNLIPVPVGHIRGESEGWGTPLEGWDKYIAETVKRRREDYPWGTKINRAVFRGALQMQSYKLGTCNVQNHGKCERARRWDQVARGVMYRRAQSRPDLFDVTFTRLRSKPSAGFRQMVGAPKAGEGIEFADMQKYKYILNVGSNQDWAERLRSYLFMNSAVVMHMAETKEFFTPLLQPWRHVIPANLMLTDLVRNVKWAVSHDDEVRKIVQNMNQFAESYLSERSMATYWKLALSEYATRQQLAAGPRADAVQGVGKGPVTNVPPAVAKHPVLPGAAEQEAHDLPPPARKNAQGEREEKGKRETTGTERSAGARRMPPTLGGEAGAAESMSRPRSSRSDIAATGAAAARPRDGNAGLDVNSVDAQAQGSSLSASELEWLAAAQSESLGRE
jgi:hypothetical protein